MVKKSKKYIVAKYEGSKNIINIGTKKKDNIVVIYNAKSRRYAK